MEFIYQCPVCKQKLEHIGQSFVCQQKHTYDISRKRYVNFLLANQKKTKNPGDNKFMTENREQFLERGYYDPLSDEINKIIIALIVKAPDSRKNINILDAGSGVGIYSDKLKRALENKNVKDGIQLCGIDISKPAIQKSSKKYPGIQFCVGSTFDLPYLNESFDIIFSIFSPFDPQELFRVLKPGGYMLMVRPGASHLKELGALIYDRFQLQGNTLDLTQNFDSDITFLEKHQLAYQIHMKKNEDIMSLIAMTPYYWHLNSEKKALLAEISEFTTSVDFQLSLFQKSKKA